MQRGGAGEAAAFITHIPAPAQHPRPGLQLWRHDDTIDDLEIVRPCTTRAVRSSIFRRLARTDVTYMANPSQTDETGRGGATARDLLLTRRARNALGTATQYTHINDSPHSPEQRHGLSLAPLSRPPWQSLLSSHRGGKDGAPPSDP
jgi:hypothetical protein